MVAVAFVALLAGLALWLPCVLHTLPPSPASCHSLSLAWSPWSCLDQPSFVLHETPWWELLGQGQEPACSGLSDTVLGCADTQGASHGITLPLRALGRIPTEPLGIPGHGLALLRGNSSAITCGHRERLRPS